MKALGGALLGMHAHCGTSKCRDNQVQYQDDCASDILQLTYKKLFDLVVVATPGRSFSRAVMDRAWGPRPSRRASGTPGCELQHVHVARRPSPSPSLVFCSTRRIFVQSPSRSRRPLGILGETRDLLDWTERAQLRLQFCRLPSPAFPHQEKRVHQTRSEVHCHHHHHHHHH